LSEIDDLEECLSCGGRVDGGLLSHEPSEALAKIVAHRVGRAAAGTAPVSALLRG
jgi:hypothetical protein